MEKQSFLTRFLVAFAGITGNFRDWLVERMGAAGAKRFKESEEKFARVVEYVNGVIAANKKEMAQLQAAHRQSLEESGNALMAMLTLLGVQPGELHDSLQLAIEEAIENADGWQNRAEDLTAMVKEAKANQIVAEKVAKRYSEVAQWAPIPEQTLLDLSLPEPAPAVSD